MTFFFGTKQLTLDPNIPIEELLHKKELDMLFHQKNKTLKSIFSKEENFIKIIKILLETDEQSMIKVIIDLINKKSFIILLDYFYQSRSLYDLLLKPFENKNWQRINIVLSVLTSAFNYDSDKFLSFTTQIPELYITLLNNLDCYAIEYFIENIISDLNDWEPYSFILGWTYGIYCSFGLNESEFYIPSQWSNIHSEILAKYKNGINYLDLQKNDRFVINFWRIMTLFFKQYHNLLQIDNNQSSVQSQSTDQNQSIMDVNLLFNETFTKSLINYYDEKKIIPIDTEFFQVDCDKCLNGTSLDDALSEILNFYSINAKYSELDKIALNFATSPFIGSKIALASLNYITEWFTSEQFYQNRFLINKLIIRIFWGETRSFNFPETISEDGEINVEQERIARQLRELNPTTQIKQTAIKLIEKILQSSSDELLLFFKKELQGTVLLCQAKIAEFSLNSLIFLFQICELIQDNEQNNEYHKFYIDIFKKYNDKDALFLENLYSYTQEKVDVGFYDRFVESAIYSFSKYFSKNDMSD